MSDAPRVGVVGLGLIGGSLARALVDRGREVVAATRAPATRADAARLGIAVVDGPEEVAPAVDVVVVATPLPVLADTLAAVGGALGTSAASPTVTDVGSVKVPIAAAAGRSLPDPSVFVPGHPMAGTERAGWEAGSADLFVGARWALAVEHPVDLVRWAAVASVALEVGATVVPVDSGEHDAAVARISHLPYVLAAAGAALVEGEGAALARTLAAGSFADLTRVAGGNPDLGADMARANRAALAPEVSDLARRLAALGAALEAGDDEVLATAFALGRRGRDALGLAGAGGGTRTLRADRDQLLAVGRRGGWVTAVGPVTSTHVEVTVVEPGVGR